MKILTIPSLALIGLMSVLAVPSWAQTTTVHHDNTRLHHQAARIRQGVRSGQLTRREANRLRARDAAIRYHEARARVTGGRISRAERRRLNRQLNRTSHSIYRQKHDAQRR